MAIYKGKAKRIDDIDLPATGSIIGVGEDVMHALIEVETRGTGFDAQGRVIILFEPHVFYKHLRGAKRQQAVDEGLAYPKWGMKKYPSDSYPRLNRAMAIDETAALKSCSWGMGQIMGENFGMVGFGSVQEMVTAFAADEDTHLRAMVEFIKAAGIADDLRRIEQKTKKGQTVTAADWIPVVRVYNGAGFAKNDYHNRAARAYNKWLKIRDTPWAAGMSLKAQAAIEELSYGDSDNAEENDFVADPSGNDEQGGASMPPRESPQGAGGLPVPPASAPVPVPQAKPAEDENPPASATSLKAKMVAIPAALLTYFSAVWAWIQSSPAHLIVALVIAAAVITTVYIILNIILKDRRERRDNDLKLQREKQAHELTLLQANSARSTTDNTVVIVPQPIENSDDKTPQDLSD